MKAELRTFGRRGIVVTLLTAASALMTQTASFAQVGQGVLRAEAAKENREDRARVQPDHVLRSSPDNVQWGGFPVNLRPVLKIKSGQTVSIDTLTTGGATADLSPSEYFAPFGVQPGEILRDVFDFWATIPPRGTKIRYGAGHILTGPIYMDAAEPGDMLEVQILDINTRVPYGINSTAPTSGVFSTTYPGFRLGDPGLNIPAPAVGAPGGLFPGVRQHLYRTAKVGGRDVALFSDDIHVPLGPFFGVMATTPTPDVFVGNDPGVLPPYPGVQHSTPPGRFGGNMDSKLLQAGTTLYLPVFQPGAQFYVGDPHSVQGDGEVSGTAIEHSLTGVFRFVLHKRKPLEWPRAENDDYYIMMGIDFDLDRAMRNATLEVVKFLVAEKGLTEAQAYSLASIAVDFTVSEVVDRTQVVSGKIPKKLFLKNALSR